MSEEKNIKIQTCYQWPSNKRQVIIKKTKQYVDKKSRINVFNKTEKTLLYETKIHPGEKTMYLLSSCQTTR